MSDPRVFFIAEAGVNHNGDPKLALEMVDAAAEAKADAIKFQTFDAAKLVTAKAAKAAYQKRTTDGDDGQLGMLRQLELPREAYGSLTARCQQLGIAFMSTPFDEESVDLLVGAGVARMKVGSGDVTNAPLLLKIARTGLPTILSTGASTLGDVERALGALAYGYQARSDAPSARAFTAAFASDEGQRLLRERVVLLHCVSEYPAPVRDVNLRAMETLRNAFGLEVGYSDHTMGTAASVAAVALGATVIEKHFTLNRTLPGPDHPASLEPLELARMVADVRDAAAAVGMGGKRPAPSELGNREVVRRSVVAACPIRTGESLTRENLTVKRPAGGRSPFELWDLLGKTAERDYNPDDPI